mmetsp:Transcript_24485/g.61962  ORF Transcript_24485/g.61962 Transcript_24485/m.61962 type:complete len:204 (-) Transcript_24485:111-722(-)
MRTSECQNHARRSHAVRGVGRACRPADRREAGLMGVRGRSPSCTPFRLAGCTLHARCALWNADLSTHGLQRVEARPPAIFLHSRPMNRPVRQSGSWRTQRVYAGRVSVKHAAAPADGEWSECGTSVMRSFLVDPLPKGLLRAVSIAFVDPRFLAPAGHALGARNRQICERSRILAASEPRRRPRDYEVLKEHMGNNGLLWGGF